jgi:hypothetical protein
VDRTPDETVALRRHFRLQHGLRLRVTKEPEPMEDAQLERALSVLRTYDALESGEEK